MIQLPASVIDDLIRIESGIHYAELPPDGVEPYIFEDRNAPVLISAPHGAVTYRNNSKEIWHEEDEYTAGMALLLGQICKVPVIATHYKNASYDPNHNVDENIGYKQILKCLIETYGVRFVIDLHGAALMSRTLEPQQTIDLGLRQRNDSDKPSMDGTHIQELERLLENTDLVCDSECFVTRRNKFPGAGKGTVITFATSLTMAGTQRPVQAVQIEMKPQVRVAHRFTSASLFASCGPYDANPACVLHMIQSLAEFIEYLITTQE